jgi:hypothetical protein
MKTFISFALEISGIIVLTLGYRKSNRNLMLLGAVLLWTGGSVNDMVHGYLAGYKAGASY